MCVSTGENDGVGLDQQLSCTQNFSLMHTQSQSIHNMSLQYPTFSNFDNQLNSV